MGDGDLTDMKVPGRERRKYLDLVAPETIRAPMTRLRH
jgi:hypothetical protein